MHDLTALPSGLLEALIGDVPRAELAMLEAPQVDCPVIHRFSPGIYIREVHIPAGTLAIGHRQKHEHLNVFLRGRVSVVNENGSVTELVAPMIFTAPPGRKVGWVHEDMVWLNVYPTAETNVERLEAELLEKSFGFEEYVAVERRTRTIDRERDRADFFAALDEFGISPEQAREQAHYPLDLIAAPPGGYKCKVGPSCIEGAGLIATAPIAEGEIIMPARIGGRRTPAGRYTNHGSNPNARMIMRENGDIDLVALREIRGCAGGGDGEEITIDYRQALALQIERAK